MATDFSEHNGYAVIFDIMTGLIWRPKLDTLIVGSSGCGCGCACCCFLSRCGCWLCNVICVSFGQCGCWLGNVIGVSFVCVCVSGSFGSV